MARSDNCVNMHIKNIQWRSDFLNLYFWTLKGNQTGDRQRYPRHVYSNTNDPIICPVIALDQYIFSNTNILTTNSSIFPGSCQYDIFLKIFHKVIKENFIVFSHPDLKKECLENILLEKEILKYLLMDAPYIHTCIQLF